MVYEMGYNRTRLLALCFVFMPVVVVRVVLSCCNVSVFCFMPVVVVVMMFVHLVVNSILFGSVKFKFKCF